MTACVASAAQADLPKNKRRFWSRPLVALLYLLQPMVRGWARYQGRVTLQPMPDAVHERLEALQIKAPPGPADELFYWAERRVDRIEFLEAILRRLDLEGWPNKADSGWNDYDIEVYGHRWSRLQLTTVSEDCADGRRLFRCRLRARWSWPAAATFWAALAGQMFVLGISGRNWPWLWLLLISVPLFGAYLQRERRELQQVFAVFLDEIADRWKMTKLGLDPEKGTFVPRPPP
jgi:O-antigen biosynthesis protein